MHSVRSEDSLLEIPSWNAQGHKCFRETHTELMSSESQSSCCSPTANRNLKTTSRVPGAPYLGSYLIRVCGSASMEGGGHLVRRDGFTKTPWPGGQRKYTLSWTVPLCLPAGPEENFFDLVLKYGRDLETNDGGGSSWPHFFISFSVLWKFIYNWRALC